MSSTDVETPPPHKAPLKSLKLAEDDEDEDTKRKKKIERTFWTRLWQGIAGASLGINVAAMAIEGSAVTIAAGVVACVIAPFVIKRQMDLQDTDSLRKVQNLLRKEVNRLQVENNKLESSINELETQVSDLQESEKKLDAITKKQGTSVNKLVGLVKENAELQRQMNEALKQDTLQSILQIVLDSDYDQSYDIGIEEIDMLHMRLNVDPRVVVDEEKMRQKAKENPIPIPWIIHNFSGQVPLEERVFYLKEEKERLDAEAAAAAKEAEEAKTEEQ